MGRSRNDVPKITVVLRLPENQVSTFITRARMIRMKMTDNPWFPSPPVSLTQLDAAIDDLAHAAAVALTRAAGSVAVRESKRQDVKGLLEYLATYVQEIANANLANAYEIVQSAGMFVKNSRGRSPTSFHAEPTGRSGEVEVVAPYAGDRAFYEFQFSLDGGKTWQPFPQQTTNYSKALLPGLTPGSTVHFRYRVTLKGVTGDWIGPVSIEVE